jgi:hypothetical protein
MRHEIRARFRVSGERLQGEGGLAGLLYTVFREKLGWKDAEGFLEFLDGACDPSGHQARRLNMAFAHLEDGKDLCALARRIVAAECCTFLEGNPALIRYGKDWTVSERWIPYLEWASRLSAEDTIITFNYDRLLEKLSDDVRLAASNEYKGGLVPITLMDRPALLRAPLNSCRLFKLHGSVDWLLNEDDSDFRVEIGYPWLENPDKRLAIGTPGPGKLSGARGPFRWLWDAAEKAVEVAEEVILVGYRFPETDAYARNRILGALRKSGVQEARIILGLGSPDAPRVESLLGLAAIPAVRVEHLWAEEFLDQWRP